MLAMNCLEVAKRIAILVEAEGGRAYLAGGSVRNMLLGREIKDVDIEVYGIPSSRLRALISEFGPINEVGKAFSVFRIQNMIDVSLPRRETKAGAGHRGFEVTGDPLLSFIEACRRRDFTINSMLQDLLTGETIDPFGGREDLQAGIIRAVDPKTFVEDSLRVYRAAQFAARLGFKIDSETLRLASGIDLEDLAKERVFAEFSKIMLEAPAPSRGLEALKEMAVLRYYPELDVLKRTPQEKQWHPEGDVWVHTLMVVDQAAEASRRWAEVSDREALMWGALCHDLGKPLTTRLETEGPKRGRITSYQHEEAGEAPIRRFLGRLTDKKRLIERIVRLAKYHLRPAELYKQGDQEVTDRAILRLVQHMEGDIWLLIDLARCDSLGRGAEARWDEFAHWLIGRVQRLNLNESKKIKPLLRGRDLLPCMAPGPQMGKVLKVVFEAQIDGKIKTPEEAMDLAKGLLAGQDDTAWRHG
jgi:tRNA nucleotidyltransferase (CCA-adding enzyme)